MFRIISTINGRLKNSIKLFNSNGPKQCQVISRRYNESISNTDANVDALRNLTKMLDQIPENVGDLTNHEIDEILDKLVKLTKVHRIRGKFLNHRKFHSLCDELYRRTRDEKNLNRAIKTLISFQKLKYPATKFNCGSILRIIQKNIDEIHLKQALSLEQTLKSKILQRSPLCEALTYALPALFDKKFDAQLNSLNNLEKIDLLNYIVDINYRIPNKRESIEAILEALLHKKDEELDASAAIRILFALSHENFPDDFEFISNLSNKAIENATEVLINNVPSLMYSDILAAIIGYKKLLRRNELPQSILKFLNAAVDRLLEIDCSFDQLLTVLDIFNYMGFANIDLLNNLASRIENDTKLMSEADSTTLYRLLESFEKINYKPHNWNSIIWPAIECNLIYNICDENLAHITTSLITLGHFSKTLIETVLSREYLRNYIKSVNDSDATYFPVLFTYMTAKQHGNTNGFEYTITGTEQIQYIIDSNIKNIREKPLTKYLCDKIGPNKYLNSVLMECGTILSIVKIDKCSREFLEFNVNGESGEVVPFESIEIGENEILIAVIITKQQNFLLDSDKALVGRMDAFKKSLELHVPTVFINMNIVFNLPENQRAAHMIQEIRDESDKLLTCS